MECIKEQLPKKVPYLNVTPFPPALPQPVQEASAMPKRALAAFLGDKMALRPGMRLLDLECGAALSSILFADRYGAQVWAHDAWTLPESNVARVHEVGLEDRVFPMHGTFNALPYARGFFDAVVWIGNSVGQNTAHAFFDYLAQFVKPGGQLGVVSPALMQLKPGYSVPWPGASNAEGALGERRSSWRTVAYWRRNWEQAQNIRVEDSGLVSRGWRCWLKYAKSLEERGVTHLAPLQRTLEIDRGENIGFVWMTATKK